MKFRVLGSLAAQGASGPLELGGPRQRSVLARLLIAGGDVVSVDRLLEDLWNGEPPPRAVGSLQAFVSNLRRTLEPDRAPRSPARLLVSSAPGYALQVGEGDEVDARDFERQAAEGSRLLAEGRPVEAGAVLDAALALWRGEAYADFADEQWAAPEVARLAEWRLVAREHRMAAALAAGESAQAVPTLETLAREHPLREGPWRLLALALYRTDRQAEALDVLRRSRELLAGELGLDPTPAAALLERQVLAQAPELDWSAPRESRSTAAIPSRQEPLPAPEAVAGNDPIGRAAPVQALLAAAGEALSGGVRIAIVSGESGIGKTFLAESVSERLRTGGWRIAWGRCPEAEGVPALWPWQQLLAPLVSAFPAAPDIAMRFANLLGTETAPSAASSDGAEARFRQHDAVARHLAHATAKEPLLIVLDDLQWADAASLRLLLDIVALRRGGRMLVLATLRTGEENPFLDDALGRLGRDGALRLSLDGLDGGAIAELSATLGLALDASQVAQLAARTAGNPFLLQESVKLAATVGADAAEALLAGVPPTVRDVLQRRLGRLPDETRSLLATAAVLGRDVDPELLSAVTFEPEEQVLDGLDLATVQGVLIESGQGQLRFAHDLVRETLESDLPPMRRTRIHARASQALEARGGSASAIAYHALAAGPSERRRAAQFAYAAGISARQRLAFDDAAGWFTKAVDLARADAEPDWAAIVALQLDLVRAQLDAGEWIAARETRAAAIRAADLTDDPDLPLRALVAMDAPAAWTLHSYAEVDLDIALRTERALPGLASGDSELRCRILGTLAAELYDGTDDPRCDELSRESVEMARRLGDPRLLAVALTHRYHAVNQPRFAAELVALGQELVDLGAQEGMPAFELLGHEVLAMYRLQLFDIRGADDAAAACEPLLRRLSLRPAAAIHHVWQAMRLLADGRVDEAEEAFAHSLTEQQALGLFGTEPLTEVVAAMLDITRGAWNSIARKLGALDIASPLFAHSVRVWSLAESGQVGEARALIDAENPPVLHDWSQLPLLAVAAQAAVAAGHPGRMHWCYEQLLPYSGWFAVGGNALVLGPVDYHLAELAYRIGDAEAGEAHRLRAAADCREAGLLWWAERTQALVPEQRGPSAPAATSKPQVVR
ncbi:MAG TPA: BTAD domain-containing putative transcriptional regulator [Frankiaceae bacterium]|jgi:DNA-binding SARP family transcriptional activator|nr:BTAD domain-containing putative transcriptional regulator [Frankiaceae bacterium]